jgi:hypothetical protein
MPINQPIARVMAQQDAIMQRMFADIDALMAMPMPDPTQMIRSVMNGMPRVAPGSGIVVTSITTGNGTCTQTITYGENGAPRVRTSSTGNGCDALRSSGPVQVTQPLSPPRPVDPAPVAPRHQRLWTVGYPPHPVQTHRPPRT